MALVTFCNTFPRGVGAGLIDLATGEFRWIDLAAVAPENLGVDGICRWKGSLWIAPQLAPGGVSGLIELDDKLQPRHSFPLTLTRDAHSLIPYGDSLLITDTAANRLNELRWNEQGQPHESVFWQSGDADHDRIHVNSVAELDGEIYVSLMGPKPEQGWFEAEGGQIVNISRGTVVADGLAHPHSLVSHNQWLYWLESRRGRVHRYRPQVGHDVIVETSGYLRGLAVDNQALHFGASALRRRSRSTGVMCQHPTAEESDWRSWVYRFDVRTRQLTRRCMTAFGAEIYDIALVPGPVQSGLDRDLAVTQRLWQCEDAVAHEAAELAHVRQELQTASQVAGAVGNDLGRRARDLVAQARYNDALPILKSLIMLEPDSQVWAYLLAIVIHSLGGDQQEALRLYTRALENGMEEFWVRYNRGSLLAAMGRAAEARADLRRAVELDPSNEDARRVLMGVNVRAA